MYIYLFIYLPYLYISIYIFTSTKLRVVSLKYQRFTKSGCKDIGIRKYKFTAKTMFIYSLDSDHVRLSRFNTIAGIFIKIDLYQFYYSYQYDLATQTDSFIRFNYPNDFLRIINVIHPSAIMEYCRTPLSSGISRIL